MSAASPTERRAGRDMVDAVRDGDWKRCGACGSHMALGVEAIRKGARLPCKTCGVWNRLDVPEAIEG